VTTYTPDPDPWVECPVCGDDGRKSQIDKYHAERARHAALVEKAQPFASDTAGFEWNEERERDECWACQNAYPMHDDVCIYAALRAALIEEK
jgi:hypothetical protein